MLYGSRLRGFTASMALAMVACDGAPGEAALTHEAAGDEARRPEAFGEEALQRRPPGAATSGGADGGTCSLPPDCERASLIFASLEPCCTERVACGFDVGRMPEEYRETVAMAVGLSPGETCAPRERFFIKHPGSEDMRLETDEGEQILLSTQCETASLLSISFIGCCMPNNRCGVSTYGIWDTLAVIAPNEPFSRLQCVSSTELNAQIARSPIFRPLRFMPDTDSACDYAALDAQLPPIEPDPW